MTHDIPSSEYAETAAFWAWVYATEGRWPVLQWVYHCPNEAKRGPRVARQIGVRAGVPDVQLPISSYDGEYVGWARELKYGTNKLTDPQAAWLAALTLHGWDARVTRMTRAGDWAIVARELVAYLGLPPDTAPGG